MTTRFFSSPFRLTFQNLHVGSLITLLLFALHINQKNLDLAV
jgi:hypothetical protein